jgi:4-hydroxy-tetrahydrodipicolinate reductase
MALRIGIFGQGRLGSAVAAAAAVADDLEVSWTVGRQEPAGPVDVALDLSHADAVPLHLKWAHATGTDLVIGATGWDRALLADADDGTIGVLTAPNFSLSVALMRRLALVLGRYAAQSPVPTDLAVSEVHHTAKVDAPSGTAVLLGRALAEGAGRAEDEVQTASLRLGAVVGRHDVRLETAAERIVLTHEAHSREVFVPGALAAARWVHRRPGIHSFDDLAADALDPLFATTPT